MRYLLLLALALAILLPALTQAQPLPPSTLPSGAGARVTQVDTARYPEVDVYVSVTGSDGQPVSGLNAPDFRLTEDGTPVTISGFAGGGAGPISAVLVLDRSNSMREAGKMAAARAAAHTFVGLMRPGDRTALLAFDGSGAQTLRRFSDDQAFLNEAIDGIRFGGGTAIYDALIAGVDTANEASGRRAVLLLTDGQDCRDLDSMTCPAEAGSRNTMSEAIAYANRHGQPIYTIGLGDALSTGQDGVDDNVLRGIAEGTGGSYFYAPRPNHLANLYRTLAGSLQQEYRLTYTSPRPFYDGTRRDIAVALGNAPAATGAYVERHLVNIQSNPLVGLLLLLPIIGALLLPRLIRRAHLAPQPPAVQTQHLASQPQHLASEQHCQHCDAELTSGARFCDQCGNAQPTPAAQRSFCAECGRPLRVGANYCAGCGVRATSA